MRQLICPDNETLQRLLLGRLPDAERAAWEEHLLDCPNCAATAETLNVGDSLTEAIARGRIPQGDEELLQGVICQAKSLGSKLEPACAAETQGDGPLPQWPASESVSARPASANFDFLAPAQQPDELGRLGNYRVLKLLGTGGMGFVLLAEDVSLGRPVALKVMKQRVAARPESKARFLREARATAALSHDHIVQIYQVGEDRGVPFIAMQYLAGESLQTRFKRSGRLPQREVARIGREVALGLAAAHE